MANKTHRSQSQSKMISLGIKASKNKRDVTAKSDFKMQMIEYLVQCGNIDAVSNNSLENSLMQFYVTLKNLDADIWAHLECLEVEQNWRQGVLQYSAQQTKENFLTFLENFVQILYKTVKLRAQEYSEQHQKIQKDWGDIHATVKHVAYEKMQHGAQLWCKIDAIIKSRNENECQKLDKYFSKIFKKWNLIKIKKQMPVVQAQKIPNLNEIFDLQIELALVNETYEKWAAVHKTLKKKKLERLESLTKRLNQFKIDLQHDAEIHHKARVLYNKQCQKMQNEDQEISEFLQKRLNLADATLQSIKQLIVMQSCNTQSQNIRGVIKQNSFQKDQSLKLNYKLSTTLENKCSTNESTMHFNQNQLQSSRGQETIEAKNLHFNSLHTHYVIQKQSDSKLKPIQAVQTKDHQSFINKLTLCRSHSARQIKDLKEQNDRLLSLKGRQGKKKTLKASMQPHIKTPNFCNSPADPCPPFLTVYGISAIHSN